MSPRLLLLLLGPLANVVQAQTPGNDLGRREYDNSCAACHGAQGRGDGPVARHLVKPPADLTQLARRNGGVFPAQRVLDTIDGRDGTEGGPHGSREMPVWGQVYRIREQAAAASDISPGWYVRGRLLALTDYLARIQDR